MLQDKSIEHIRKDHNEKRITNKNQVNQCHNKATKAPEKKIGKHKCRDEQKNWETQKLRKENREKQIEKTKTKKREDEREKLKKKMKERKVGSKNLNDTNGDAPASALLSESKEMTPCIVH